MRETIMNFIVMRYVVILKDFYCHESYKFSVSYRMGVSLTNLLGTNFGNGGTTAIRKPEIIDKSDMIESRRITRVES